MIPKETLVFDIETDSQNPNEANLKWFGVYSYRTETYSFLDYTQKDEIEKLIKNHKYIIGFNNKQFDQPVTERSLNEECFEYKIILDLWECLAPKGNGGFGQFNKNRLVQMGFKELPNYKLKTIIQTLKLDSENKGDIDYNIFKKDSWTDEEKSEIEFYLKKDVELTKKLYEWYFEQFKPLMDLLNKDDKRKLKHLKCSIPSLAYAIICNKAGLSPDFAETKPQNLKSYSGGHHINPRWDLVTGNIIEIDFASAYPHAMMMCNLFSPSKEGWNGNGYYSVKGTYNNQEKGKVEAVINHIYKERQKAKQTGDRPKNLSYKLIINSAYGLTGNWKFKSLYNPTTASDCTHIVRTWMKKLAKHLEENGFICLYGFTDSIFVKIPEQSNKEELMFVVDKVLEEFKSNTPFPLNSFKMDIEEEIKMIWFVAKNCYLYVTQDNKIKYKSTLLNKNTPHIVLDVFDSFMKPKIIENLNPFFLECDLIKEIKKRLTNNPELSAEEYRVNNLESYKVKTSRHYEISKTYGPGTHLLIPNTSGVGIGKSKGTKKQKPVRHCTIEEFKQNHLSPDDIDIKNLIKHLKPFIRKEESEQ